MYIADCQLPIADFAVMPSLTIYQIGNRQLAIGNILGCIPYPTT
jgi:hypothetical protein